MSRVFKASNVNVGQPLKISTNEDFVEFTKHRVEREIGSDTSNCAPSISAANIISVANIEANEIIANAKLEANVIIESAIVDAQRERKIELQKGYDAGFNKGFIEGKSETEDLAQQALEIKQDLEEEKEFLLQKFKSHIPDLIIQGIKKIIGMELKTDKEIIVTMVSNALKRVNSNSAIIKLSEDDFEMVFENKDIISSQNRNVSDFEIKKDMSICSGDCIIETQYGEIDASIGVQLDNLSKALSKDLGDNYATK